MTQMTPKEYRALMGRVAAEQCRRSMHRYMTEVVWPVVEPGTEFIDNWHMHAICEHLEAVLKGEIKNLLVNMPPRFAKSLLIAVTMPTWAWIDRPALRSIFASYSAQLSTRDAVKSRRVIDSNRYQEYYGDRFTLSSDQNVKQRYENDKTGMRFSTSVGGAATGEGGDIIVVDDPHNVLEADSDVSRGEALVWWDETMSTRLNNPKRGGKIIVMQRVNELDLSGHVLEKGDYEHLMIPMRYEEPKIQVGVNGNNEPIMEKAPKPVTSIGFSDPRNEEGELAWKERFDEESVTALEKAMGTYAVAGQFQQRPSPRGGALIQVENLKYVDIAPVDVVWVRSWDFAATEEQTGTEPAYTAGVKIGKDTQNRFYIGHVHRKRLSVNDVRKLVKSTAEMDGKQVHIRGPQDPGQAGKAQASDFIAQLAGWNTTFLPESGSKVQRAEPFAAQVEAGNVFIVRGSWNTDYVEELGKFPAGKYKDQVDATSNGFNHLIPLPNNVGNLMEYMQRKLAAQQKEQAQQRPNNPYADRTEGARNVTDLAGLIARIH